MRVPPTLTTAREPGRLRWFGTLKVRLMLASALVIAASVAVSTTVVLDRVERRSEQALMDLERDNAERMASLLAQRVIGLQSMLRAAVDAMPPTVAGGDTAAAADFLARAPALKVAFSSVFVADATGRVAGTGGGDAGGRAVQDIGQDEDFRLTLTMGLPVVSAPRPTAGDDGPEIRLTLPVRGAHGLPVAVLGGTLRLAARNLFDDFTFAGTRDGDPLTTIVTDAQGTIISHPQRDRLLTPVAAEPVLAATVARWVAQGRPIEPSGVASHVGGYIVSMAGVPGADWMVFRALPDTLLLGGVAQAHRESLLWAFGVALVGSLMILALVALLLGPLSRLRRRALALHDSTRRIDEGWPRDHGEIGELSAVLRRVLRERALGEQSQHLLVQQMRSVLAAAPIGIGFTRDGRFELAGAEFCALLGWPEAALVGRSVREILARPEGFETVDADLVAAFAAGRPYIDELELRRRDGSRFWGRVQGRPVDAQAPDAGTILLLEDVTEKREALERLSWSASHDALTRLLNRAAFGERLAAWLAQPEDGLAASLVFIDLDRFKQVNDQGGHAAGDAVLRAVGELLLQQVRAGDAAARLGGDEFVLLLPGCTGPVAMAMGERVRAAIAEISVPHAGHSLSVDASIGVVQMDRAAELGADDWLARVDAACYDAKRAGRGLVRLARSGPPLRAVSTV